ncbi:DUF1878 domain-containing protein [Bacillus velezensis]|nr:MULTISPECIES: hypothetical protein [Bacillus]AQS45120.1 hypothetical protein BVH55_14835 [Bacillus velezensis]MBT0954647.1 DUF1878 domain-containing protein [Bacillus velezensis]MCQ9193114.1 DUF1878 domain-containing protein [Bacillus velezensis]MCX2917308.1 DUF1878 domain-containing protein [Bacillus velezensis]MCY6276202.1 DUF1878 domain-containing protein [Bacillus sp. NEAU-16]
MFFEYKITEEQVDQIYDLFDDYRTRIENKMDVHHGSFEQALYKIVPEQNGNYHFVEFLAKELFDAGRWQEVFEKLYGNICLNINNYLRNNQSILRGAFYIPL